MKDQKKYEGLKWCKPKKPPNKKNHWEFCHEDRKGLKLTGFLLPALQKAELLAISNPLLGYKKGGSRETDGKECSVCLFSGHPRSWDLKTSVAFVLKGAVK